VDIELERFEDTGVDKPVLFSDWASPIITVVKYDGRVCRFQRDYKPSMQCDTISSTNSTTHICYFIQRQELQIIDLSHAYHQLLLAEETHKYIVIKTHKGLFAKTIYNKTCYFAF